MTFSDHARTKLLDLYNDHSHEVGSRLKATDPAGYASYSSTNCITYAINVISYAFNQTGDSGAAAKVEQLRDKPGNQLSRYLVTSHQWKGIYINADTVHPRDGSREHTTAERKVNRSCTYYSIPVRYRVVNYRPTTRTEPAFQKLNKRAPLTRLNDADIRVLNRVPFGFGISRGAMHTWLFSMGRVYEVHWDEIGAGLYERTMLRAFAWLSGAIVVPPDRSSLLRMSSQRCQR